MRGPISHTSRCLLAVAVLLSPDVPRAGEQQALAVMPLRTQTLNATTVSVLDDLLLAALAERGRLKTIGQSDIGALIGMEKLKESLGCDDVTCAVEIGGALGVRYLLVGTVDRLGSSVVLTLSLLDTGTSQALARQRHKVPADEDVYYDAIIEIVGRLLSETDLARGVVADASVTGISGALDHVASVDLVDTGARASGGACSEL